MHRVTLLLDEISPVLHELPQRHHGVVIDVEPVVGRPRFHGDEHDASVQLLLEDLVGGREGVSTRGDRPVEAVQKWTNIPDISDS